MLESSNLDSVYQFVTLFGNTAELTVLLDYLHFRKCHASNHMIMAVSGFLIFQAFLDCSFPFPESLRKWKKA